jgi:transcriptional regulator with XRE-family HTH domain
MAKITITEKLLVEALSQVAKNYQLQVRKLSLRKTLILIRKKLRMSQQTLAKRAQIPQATLSRIESGKINPTIAMLERIFRGLFCDLAFLPIPQVDLDHIVKERIHDIAKKRVQYLKGTMALELQQPSDAVIQELIAKEEQELLASRSFDIWSERDAYGHK